MTTDWGTILPHYPEITGIHPAADLFPMVEGDEFRELCADIKKRGLAQPITIWTDGTLLDGRNRLMACFETHQEVVLDCYEGTDPVQFSLSANLHRRHLNQGQKAMVALKVEEIFAEEAKERQRNAGIKAVSRPRDESGKIQLMANLPQAGIETPLLPAPEKQSQPPARDQAAAVVGASGRSVQMAKSVAKAAPDLADKVERGVMPLHRAYRETQERQLSQPLPEEVKWSEDEMRRRKIVEAGGVAIANMHSGKDEYLLRWSRSNNRFIRIDRQSPLGNPYELPSDGDRDAVCDSFEIYFARKYSLHSQLSTLRGKVLGCWCYPERCHGQHLASLAEKLGGQSSDF
jgi:ParB-like chromosome segregation protein Spo0J